MAVYERLYRPYAGPLTPTRWRFTVLPRFGLREIFASRAFIAFFSLCFVWPLVLAILIYLRHNAQALAVLELSLTELLPIDPPFFLLWVVKPLGSLAFLLALIVGPALVSPDLRNNALPLYLARPFGRGEYLLGKLSTLCLLLSAVTWVPALLLLALQAYLEGGAWAAQHVWLAPALLVSFCVWILMLSAAAIALSAWLKSKLLARLVFLGSFLMAEAVGTVINVNFRTSWGSLLKPFDLRDTVSSALLRDAVGTGLAPAAAWMGVLGFCAAALLLAALKVKAYEVER